MTEGIEARLRAVPCLPHDDGDHVLPDYAALAALVEELLVAHGIMCADSAVAAGAAWAKKAVERATEIDALKVQLDAKEEFIAGLEAQRSKMIAAWNIDLKQIARLREDAANLTDSLALAEQSVRDGEQERETLKTQLDVGELTRAKWEARAVTYSQAIARFREALDTYWKRL